MATVVTSGKFSSLEVVSLLKVGGEIVFEDLVIFGENLDIQAGEKLTLTSSGTIEPDWGIEIVCSEENVNLTGTGINLTSSDGEFNVDSTGNMTFTSSEGKITSTSKLDTEITSDEGDIQINSTLGEINAIAKTSVYIYGETLVGVGCIGTIYLESETEIQLNTGADSSNGIRLTANSGNIVLNSILENVYINSKLDIALYTTDGDIDIDCDVGDVSIHTYMVQPMVI